MKVVMRSVLVSTLLISYSATAAVESFKFQSISNQDKSLSIRVGEVAYINNESEIVFTVSSGLDRKISVSLKNDTTGQSVFSTTTGVININDRIEQDGKSFYGKPFTVSATTDGNYSLSIKTIDLSNNVVSEEVYKFSRDTTPPVSSNVQGGSKNITNSLTPVGTWYVGRYATVNKELSYFKVTGVDDSYSGIDKIEFITYDLSNGGAKYATLTIPYDINKKLAMYDLAYHTPTPLFPTYEDAENLFGIEARIYDKAGNVKITPKQKVYFDQTNSTPGLKLVGVRRPGSKNVIGPKTGYDPYVPGMTVYENPISILYSAPKSEFIDNKRGGYTAYGAGEIINNTNDGKVYFVFNRTHDFKDGNYVRFIDRASWLVGYIGYDLKLSPSAPKNPVRINRPEFHYSDIGWYSDHRARIQSNQLPITIKQIRQKVEVRNYDQKFTFQGKSCVIKAGSNACSITLTPMILGKGQSKWIHDRSDLTNSTGTLVGDPIWNEVSIHDIEPPTIEDLIVDGQTATVNLTMLNQSAFHGKVGLQDVWLEDDKGERLPVIRTSLNLNTVYFQAQFDLSSLNDGSYTVTAMAKEYHGGIGRSAQSKVVLIDTKPPELTIEYSGDTNIPKEINNLRDIAIKIKDELNPVYIKEIKLTNEIQGVDVVLGYSKVSGDGTDKIFMPELPRLFPSFESGDIYTMSITARDAYDNEVSKTITFRYLPANLIRLQNQTYLPVGVELKRENDKSVAQITSNDLKLDDGRFATGKQLGIVTLKPTSSFPVKVNGVVLMPGESKNLEIDMGEAGGKLEVPIYPVNNDEIGQTDIFFEIPQLQSKYD